MKKMDLFYNKLIPCQQIVIKHISNSIEWKFPTQNLLNTNNSRVKKSGRGERGKEKERVEKTKEKEKGEKEEEKKKI